MLVIAWYCSLEREIINLVTLIRYEQTDCKAPPSLPELRMIYLFLTELTNPSSMCDIGQRTDHAYFSIRDLVSHSQHAHDEHPCHERSPCGCKGCCGWVTPA